MDFWFSVVMIFLEATRIFIRNDAFISRWLFGSTRALKWGSFNFPRLSDAPKEANRFAVIIGACINVVPVFRPKIVVGILKVALLVTSTQLIPRLRDHARNFIYAVFATAACGSIIFLGIIAEFGVLRRFRNIPSPVIGFWAFILLWALVAWILQPLSQWIFNRLPILKQPQALVKFKGVVAVALLCLPSSQAAFASHHKYYFSITLVAVPLLILTTTPEDLEGEDSSCVFTLQMVDIILITLFFWSVMFPFPGMSLSTSFCILFPALAAVLVGNLQVPVASLQILLSIMRLRSLLGHHHHEYRPLPQDASPNFVPSIVVLYMLELCQGSSYIMAIILGLFSLPSRRSLVRMLEFPVEWGAEAIDLYYHQAYHARAEKGLFPLDTPNSVDSFAVESLCCTSREMQIVGLCILHHFLQGRDCKSREKLIKEITTTSKKAVFTLVDMLGSTGARDEDIRLLAARVINKLSGSLKISQFPGMVKLLISSLLDDAENQQEPVPDRRVSENNNGGNVESIFLGLSILEELAYDPDNCAAIIKDGINNGGKIGAPFLLHSLERILHLEDSQQELWEPVMRIIAMLALDGAARHEIVSTKAIVGKLMQAFVRPDNDAIPRGRGNIDRSLRKAAGRALANLTIMSTDNCWAILFADKDHNLIKNLINMLEDEYYICVAANLLHNLCANSRDKLMDIDFGANVHMESALQKVLQIIRTKEGKQLEAALCVASQICHVTSEYLFQMLESDTEAAAAAELVEKLVDTLNSNREPSPEYPRIRRVLVEVIISIVELCPGYRKIFREKGVKDALDMVKGTPSRFEKYRVFLDEKRVMAESIPMRALVDKAKWIIHQSNSINPGCSTCQPRMSLQGLSRPSTSIYMH
ncbi:hypothetical protein PVAP13_6KG057100 [Panicum virgatum]|uniref:Uncharacterized protein n=1 Tax=Panicum virgatum TaxID=38727 RepID=A0A8T0R7P6_PANVG|nr:hypothetical protein PVAP13_6KG057100 [Panicum virgatum]